MTLLYQNLQRHAGCQFCNLNLTTSALGLLQTIWFLTPKSARRWLCFHRVVDHLPSALAIDTKTFDSVDAHKVSKVKISNGICTLMRLWLRRQRGCIFYVSSNAAEYHLPTYLRFILRSLGLSLNTVVLCGIMPSPSNYQIALSECRNRHCASSFLCCTTKRP